MVGRIEGGRVNGRHGFFSDRRMGLARTRGWQWAGALVVFDADMAFRVGATNAARETRDPGGHAVNVNLSRLWIPVAWATTLVSEL